MRVCLLLISILALAAGPIAQADAPAFDPAAFQNPEALLWPAYFWLWNAPLVPEELRAQLQDMAAHGARSVCMLPMPKAFRPDSTNNSLDPDYLTPEFFERVHLAVEEAARLGMNWWVYDEGGWPSGQALGKVVEGHPDFAAHRLAPDPAATDTAWPYRVNVGGNPDLMNPAVTDRFLELTHQRYQQAIGEFFGKTVRYTFTDEPGVPNLDPPKSITWSGTWTKDTLLGERSLGSLVPSLFVVPGKEMPGADAQARVDFYDFWTRQFQENYFSRIQTWAHGAGIGSGGHLNGEDETVNAVRYGFGQALRQLRAMDMPGIDLIWRQIFPGQNNHHFPKYASSAAHQTGGRFSFSESFCVYGNGLTPAQMKWLVDYQYVRGINVLVEGCYPLSTQDHHMTGERPHFGPCNPLWDHLPGFHAYTARVGYALSTGKPRIDVGLYYPVRDLWAWGKAATEAVETHDRLAVELLAHQCDFDLVDDDILTGNEFIQYKTLVFGHACWLEPRNIEVLRDFAAKGGKILCVDHAPGVHGQPGNNDPAFCEIGAVEEIAARMEPTVKLTVPSRDIRVCVRRDDNGETCFLFNEGAGVYAGGMETTAPCLYNLNPQSGVMTRLITQAGTVPVVLGPGETHLLLSCPAPIPSVPSVVSADDNIPLDSTLRAKVHRQFKVGDHNFETVVSEAAEVPFATASSWRAWLGEDFSGEVDYQATFTVPEAWAASPVLLQTGPIEYAATVLLDGKSVGQILWSPWRTELPALAPGAHELTIRVANTLANELTSDRVAALWAAKRGPGWPSPYHVRALAFERESRGGGITGPVMLKRESTKQALGLSADRRTSFQSGHPGGGSV